MKYKCHYCLEFLNRGNNFTLECKNCNNCFISFDKKGIITQFNVTIYADDKKYYNLIKTNYNPNTFLYHNYLLIGSFIKPLKIGDDGMPEANDLYERIKVLMTFE